MLTRLKSATASAWSYLRLLFAWSDEDSMAAGVVLRGATCLCGEPLGRVPVYLRGHQRTVTISSCATVDCPGNAAEWYRSAITREEGEA